ncbi:MAG: hypothetical protein EAX96_17270 [Candidatus Lokiarchaeota archaeon]|nr:hypothetical protein [Candidatus Lokiarchaeota archaeon]
MKISELSRLIQSSQGFYNNVIIYLFIIGLIIALVIIFIYIYRNKEKIMASIPNLQERQKLKEDFIRDKKEEENQG